MATPHPAFQTAEQIEELQGRILAGETMQELADSIGCSYSTVWEYLNGKHAAEQTRDNSARAMEASAEAWLDRGLGTIASALSKDSGIDATAARAYAQECARRAAIRNPRYRDKVDHQHSGTVRQVHELSTDELLRIAAQDSRPDVPLVERLDE